MIQELAKIAEELRARRLVPPVTVRTFLSWFNAQRRGYGIVTEIKKQLREAGIRTFPDFESEWIDAPIAFFLEDLEHKSDSEDTDRDILGETIGPIKEEPQVGSEGTNWISRDPTYRVSKLHAANQQIVSIKPDGTIAEAVTLLMSGGYSQLPVMTNDRDVKGIVTWKSIGSRLALGVAGGKAREFMDPHQEIRSDTSIFNAIPIIVSQDYVLVRGIENRITGIITSSDLSIQFRLLTEPFLLLSEIENLIRNMIGDHFSPAELAAARDPSSADRMIHTVADMTFGEYIRLLQSPDRWIKLGISIDRSIFCERLDRVREIRNGVTHFDPDGITDQDLERLRDFTNFLKQLEIIAARA